MRKINELKTAEEFYTYYSGALTVPDEQKLGLISFTELLLNQNSSTDKESRDISTCGENYRFFCLHFKYYSK